MNPVDIIVAVLLLLALWSGYRAGILRELSGIGGIVMGAYMAQHFSHYFVEWLNIKSDNQLVIFICTLVVVMVAFIALIYIVDKVLTIGGLSFPIRVLGAIAAVLKGVLLMALALSIYTHFSDKGTAPELLRESRVYPVISTVAGATFPYLKRAIDIFYVPQKIESTDSTQHQTPTSDTIIAH